MKKVGINLIIGVLVSVILIVISLLVIKPNNTYMTAFNDHIYLSTDNSTFSYNNNIISYSKLDDRLKIESTSEDVGNINIVRMNIDGRTVMDINGKIIDAYIELTTDSEGKTHAQSRFENVDVDDMLTFLKYSVLFEVKSVDNDKINVKAQKIICVILSIIIGFILSFLAYPVVLYEKIKENKKLAVFCASLTLILCLSSGFYIFFTLK